MFGQKYNLGFALIGDEQETLKSMFVQKYYLGFS